MPKNTVSDKILIDVPVPIATPRLTLRPPQAFDGQAVYKAKQESLENLLPWMPWAHKPQSIANDEALCRKKHTEFLLREDLMFLAFAGDKFIGGTGLHSPNWELGRFEIGYWVRSSEMGKGYATEIATALARYAFQALKATRVEVFSEVNNSRSKHIIEKIGAPFEGIQRNGLLSADGAELRDVAQYAFTSLEEVPPLKVSWPEV